MTWWTRLSTRERVGAFLLLTSFPFGAVMLAHAGPPEFVYLTSFHLGLTAAVLALAHRPLPSVRLWVWAPLCGLVGWYAEYVGVHGEWLFGTYTYGDVLGPKVRGIPLVMAVNWIVVVYAVCATLNRYAAGVHVVLRVGLAALAMVALDVLIEPVAIALDFWTWDLGHPPLRNYLGWLGVGVVQGGLFYAIVPYASNRLAPLALALQVLFFAYLSLVLPG